MAEYARTEVGHTFTASDADWGFSQMAPIREIEDPNSGFLVDGMLQASAPCLLRDTGPLLVCLWCHNKACTCVRGLCA